MTKSSKTVSEMTKDFVCATMEYIEFCQQFLPEEETDSRKDRRRKKHESACIRACQRASR